MRMAIRVSLYVVLSACLVSLVIVALRAETFRVSDVTIDGLSHLSAEDVDRYVREGMQGTTFGFLHKDSTFMLDAESMAAGLREAFPRIEDVSVVRNGLRGMSVTVREREPKALWCGDVVPPQFEHASSSDVGRCYFMDRTAFIYAERVDGFEDLDRYYGSLERSNPIGQHYFTEEEFSKLCTMREKLKEHDLEVASLLLVDERDMELYLVRHAARVIVPRSLSAETVVDRLVAALTSEAFDASRPLEYVDMRFETRVYVKYVDPSLEENEQGTATSTGNTPSGDTSEDDVEDAEAEGSTETTEPAEE